LANGGVSQLRSFAKEAAPADRPPFSGDGMLLNVTLHFYEISTTL
jgi:hypothetical protein